MMNALTLAPLNVFQRLARVWEKSHPYNAAQAVKIRARLDADAVERAWAGAMNAAGLGRVEVAGGGYRHEALNGEHTRYPIAVVPPGAALSAYLSAEMNRPFDDPDEPPFRPFVAEVPDGYYFGVVYRHWVADSVSVRRLLGEWFVRTYEPSRASPGPCRHPSGGYRATFGPGRPGWRGGDVLLALFRRHMRYRRARKVRAHGPRDYPTRVLLREAPPGLAARLRAYARDRRVKVNDVFLAAAAEACARFVPAQHRPNRRDVAIGSIVDLRPHAGRRLRDAFGLFLGFTEVVCPPADLRDFGRLVRRVAAQNRQHRQVGVSQSSLGWLAVASVIGRLVPDQGVYHFYRKETPLLGGVSNVNLAGTWAAEHHPSPVAKYLRLSPTGPLAPVVFTLTTLGEQLHLSMTYREVLLSEDVAAAMADAFLGRLAAVAGMTVSPLSS